MRGLFGRLDPGRRREVLWSLALLGLGLPAAVGGEALLRLHEAIGPAGPTDWERLRADILYTDEVGVVRFVPGAQSGNIAVNSLALPGPEVALPKPPGTLRIAFLGDSILLAAEIPQDQNPSAFVAAAVAEAFPGCRVDYITIAGPDFYFDTLTAYLDGLDPGVQPDAYLLLSGDVLEALTGFQAEVEADPPYLNHPEGFALQSRLWRRVGLAQHSAGPLLARLDLGHLADYNSELLDALAISIGDAPTVAVIERNRARPGMSPAEVSTYNRGLLSLAGGLTLGGLAQLEAILTRSVAQISEKHGWRLVDPLAEVPPDSVHYIDEVHLTEAGAARFAAAVSGPLIEEIAADPPSCADAPRP
jgi:hypothetical protein